MIARRALFAATAIVAPASAQELPQEVAGRSWILREIGGETAPAQPAVSLLFTPEGRAVGSGGCNRFTGGYAFAGAALRFDAIAATMMACAEPAMGLEQRFHRAMAAVRGWRIEAGALLLADEAGAPILRFTPEN
jgi:heat shock protein HslJ